MNVTTKSTPKTGEALLPAFHMPEALALREEIRAWVRAEATDQGASWEEQGTTPKAVYQSLGRAGLLGMRHDPRWGGTNRGPVASVILAEELCRSTYSGMAEAVMIHTDMSSTHLAYGGSDDMRARHLPAMLRGDEICGIAVTEPEAGSDLINLSTRAEKRAGGYVLDGTKNYVTNALHGDLIIVAARTDATAKPSRGISLFAVPTDTKGVTIRSMPKKHGMRSSDIAVMEFQGAFLPADALLYQENRGFGAIMARFEDERLAVAAMSVGMAEAAVQLTLEHVRARQAFGGTLWDLQATRQRLAWLTTQANAARALVHETATRLARGEDCTAEVLMAKPLAGETLLDIVRGCLQLHGGLGFLEGQPIERIGRDARVMTIGGGATEVLLEEVAKRM